MIHHRLGLRIPRAPGHRPAWHATGWPSRCSGKNEVGRSWTTEMMRKIRENQGKICIKYVKCSRMRFLTRSFWPRFIGSLPCHGGVAPVRHVSTTLASCLNDTAALNLTSATTKLACNGVTPFFCRAFGMLLHHSFDSCCYRWTLRGSPVCPSHSCSRCESCEVLDLEGYWFLVFFSWQVLFFLGVPASMLSCFSDFLLFCFSAFLLLCFSASLLFCFSCFSAFLLFAFPASLLFLLLCFSAFCCSCFFACLLLCFPCFSAFVLLCLSTSTILLFLFFSHVFLLLYFLLLCSFASLLPVFTVSLFFIFFCLILFCLYPNWTL